MCLSHPCLKQSSSVEKLIRDSVKVLQIPLPSGNDSTFHSESLKELCMSCCNTFKKEQDYYVGQKHLFVFFLLFVCLFFVCLFVCFSDIKAEQFLTNYRVK